MGIKLRNHIDYDIDNWLTEDEAEKLFIAAGYVKIDDNLHGFDQIHISQKHIQEGKYQEKLNLKYSLDNTRISFNLKSNSQEVKNVSVDFKFAIDAKQSFYSNTAKFGGAA